MKIGIMQPYFLPYIGYFTHINSVDKFVFLDDVQYIRRGWVNRNRIKIANVWKYITLPIKHKSLSTKIHEIYVANDLRQINKIKKGIELSYKKAPFFDEIKKEIFKLIEPDVNLSKLNISLIKKICEYLNISTQMYKSSELKKDESLTGENNIIKIVLLLKGKHYINPIGGIKIYSKSRFLENKIKLSFLKMNEIEIIYPQGKGKFIPNLSIIDTLMWNSTEEIQHMLKKYKLI